VASTTNHYDLIVIGSDVAGLVTAALVARRGKRVLVVPHGAADGTYRIGQHVLPLETAPLIHLGCPAVRAAYEELGLWTQLKRERRPIGGLVHWVLPDHRLDVAPAMENFSSESGREWPGDPVAEAWALRSRWTDAIDELLDEMMTAKNALVADGFWARRFLGRVSDKLPDHRLDEFAPLAGGHPLRDAARAIEGWLSHLTPAQMGKAASLRLAGSWARGPEDREGGMAELRRQLLGRITLKSGEVKPDLRVAEVLFKRGKITGVSLLGKKDRYGCEHLLVATHPGKLIDGPLVPEQLPRPLAATLEAIRPASRRFVLHLDVHERGLSPAFEGTAICVPRPDPDGVSWIADHGVGLTFVRTGPGRDESSRRISITRVVPDQAPLDELREQILDELEARGVLPFVRDHARLVHSPHDGRPATDGAGAPAEGCGPDSAMRLPMAALHAFAGEPVLGIGLLAHSSGIKNLSFASRLTLPGLGLEGEFAAGVAAAGSIAAGSRGGARPAVGPA
jgi:hypothetical protein